MMKERVQRKRYERKSPKTSTAVFPWGSGARRMPFIFSFIDFGRRRSLNLLACERRKSENNRKSWHAQLGLRPVLVLRQGDRRGILCLCACSFQLSVLVIVHDGGYLGVARDMFLSRESRVSGMSTDEVYFQRGELTE